MTSLTSVVGSRWAAAIQPAAQAQQLSNTIFEEHNMLQMRLTCLNAAPYMNTDRQEWTAQVNQCPRSEAVVTVHFTYFK